MFVVRALAVIVAAAIAASLIFWAFTGNPKYLRWATRLGKLALASLLLVLILLAAERLIVL